MSQVSEASPSIDVIAHDDGVEVRFPEEIDALLAGRDNGFSTEV